MYGQEYTYGQPRNAPAANLGPYYYPPTPAYTPRTSGSSLPRSGYESEGERAHKKRHSGVYVNGQKVLDLGHQSRKSTDQHQHYHHHSRNERIVIVDNPPTPRTPPHQFTFPRTAPSSPNLPYVYGTEPRPQRERPIIVDERLHPSYKVEVRDHHRSPKHSRQHSKESRNSVSFSDETAAHDRRRLKDLEREMKRLAAEEEERRRREKLERDLAKAEVKLREQERRAAEIVAANARISRRPPVPIAAIPQIPQEGSWHRPRPAVYVETPQEPELTNAFAKMNVRDQVYEDAQRRRRQQRERERSTKREEEEAQALKQRLAERMLPRRRATVGPGSRRQRVMYDDGLYRWE